MRVLARDRRDLLARGVGIFDRRVARAAADIAVVKLALDLAVDAGKLVERVPIGARDRFLAAGDDCVDFGPAGGELAVEIVKGKTFRHQNRIDLLLMNRIFLHHDLGFLIDPKRASLPLATHPAKLVNRICDRSGKGGVNRPQAPDSPQTP